MSGVRKVTPASLLRGVRVLSEQDRDLAAVVAAFGPPPLWRREPGFPTLIHIILEQQVSLASARAAYDRLLAAADPLTPARFLRFSDAELKAIGFSRQKAAYGRGLADAMLENRLDVAALERLHDAGVRAALMRVKGIGAWSASIYLLMALRRPDVWPDGDIALLAALQRVKRLPRPPSVEQAAELSRAWQPWRAVAARILWHYYLSAGSARRANGATPGSRADARGAVRAATEPA